MGGRCGGCVMTEVPEFGVREPNRAYTIRPAAYAVILNAAGLLVCVGETSGLFLPGGGVQPGEAFEETLAREVREECAFELSAIIPLGQAVQFFVSGEGVAYELQAAFFRAALGTATETEPELDLKFLPVAEARLRLFHECHRWAVAQAVAQA